MSLDNFNKPFLWRKKYEEQGIKINEKDIEREHRKKAEENKIELEKIKERRIKRELEYQQKLSDNEFLQRQKETEQHEHWEQQEDDFVLRQHRQRSKIRIRDGRMKPIDLLSHYIDVFGFKDDKKARPGILHEEEIDLSDSPVELLNPIDWFNGLRQSDLEALKPDIEVYMNTDHKKNLQYWRDLLEITENELDKLRSVKEPSAASADEINSAVLTDLMSMFEGKTITELDEMEQEMSSILASDDPSVDINFYRNTLFRLRAYRAKVRLTINHKKNLRRQKDRILDKIDHKSPSTQHLDSPEASTSHTDPSTSQTALKHEPQSTEEDNEEKEVELIESSGEEEEEDEQAQPNNRFEEARIKCIQMYKEGGYSPKMYRKTQIEPGSICLDFDKEYEMLVYHRNQICSASTLDEAKVSSLSDREQIFMETAKKGMNMQEESTFSCESAIHGANNRALTYAWADKYQPRKPRYFNRVHTGFEWNKYNQTHYDIDNPPPKVVQGYKFNIFYPDLIDKSKAPTFTLSPCKDDKDFCVIRFSAGPPYEDIAFRIVSREWNNSHKSGYRCQFINNMLQLWFQFKRYRYRR